MCVSANRNFFFFFFGWVVCLLLRKTSFSAVTEKRRWLSRCSHRRRASPKVGACLPIFLSPLDVPVPLCHPWLHVAASWGPPHALYILILSLRLCSVCVHRASSLQIMWVSQGEWICSFLLRYRKKKTSLVYVELFAAVGRKYYDVSDIQHRVNFVHIWTLPLYLCSAPFDSC